MCLKWETKHIIVNKTVRLPRKRVNILSEWIENENVCTLYRYHPLVIFQNYTSNTKLTSLSFYKSTWNNLPCVVISASELTRLGFVERSIMWEACWLIDSDGSHINPEASIISFVSRLGVDLLLDPLDRFAVESDVLGIRVRQAGSTVTVASKPLVITIVLLAVPSRGDIGVDIRAVS
jgi:hypothetical protein